MTLRVPVVHIVFNRPDHARRSLEAIRRQRPSDLFVIADGPRPDHPDDERRCSQVRELYEHIDWECRVRTDFAATNLGLKRRIVSGLDRVFADVDRAIVLEDDCVAHDDFFEFCREMLDRYEDDDRVACVTGSNFQHGQWRGDASYYFSKFNHCWGWATWARAWAANDSSLARWDQWRRTAAWVESCPDPLERRHWESVMGDVAAGRINSWAYPWMASVWQLGGLTATPNVNLVGNVGFGEDATNTHTALPGPPRAVEPLGTLIHPDAVEQDQVADRFVFDHTYGGAAMRARRNPLLWPRLGLRSALYRARRRLGMADTSA